MGSGFGQRSLLVLHVPFFFFGPADTSPIEPGESQWTLATAYAKASSYSWHAPKVHEEVGPSGDSLPFRRGRQDPSELSAGHGVVRGSGSRCNCDTSLRQQPKSVRTVELFRGEE